MIDKNFLYNAFVDVLGAPKTSEALQNYIQFCIHNHTEETDKKCENHHILPKCLFESEITVRLIYNNHVIAHKLLTEAYPIRKFLRPLQFMLPRDGHEYAEYRRKISQAIKDWWLKFRESPNYKKYIKKQREITSKKMKNGFAKYLSDKRYSNPNSRKQDSIKFKEMWKNDSMRRKIVASMITERNTVSGKKRMSLSAQLTWNNKTTEEKIKFKEIMNKTNKRLDKRKDASEKIKKMWQDPTYRENTLKPRFGIVWWNDGTREKKSKEKPGENWTRGRFNSGNLGRKKH